MEGGRSVLNFVRPMSRALRPLLSLRRAPLALGAPRVRTFKGADSAVKGLYPTLDEAHVMPRHLSELSGEAVFSKSAHMAASNAHGQHTPYRTSAPSTPRAHAVSTAHACDRTRIPHSERPLSQLCQLRSRREL